MNYLLLLTLAILLMKKGKINPSMVAPIFSIFQNMPKFNIQDLISGNIDISSFIPVVQSVASLIKMQETNTNPTTEKMQNDLSPISSFSGENVTYSLNNYFTAL